MKKSLYLITYIVCVVSLITACNSEEEKGVIPMAEKLRVTETSIPLPKEASQKTLAVESNCAWDFAVDKSDGWTGLTVQKADGGLSIQTDANTTRSSRQATITISSKSGITRKVQVTQARGDVLLEVQGSEGKMLTFFFSGGKHEFTITSNTTWQITGVADWFTIDKSSGSGTDKVEVTVNEIQTDVARNATLVVSAENGAKTDNIIIQQQGKVIELSVSPLALTLPAAGGSKDVQITCNADWTVSVSNEWVSLSEVSGSQNKVISVTAPVYKIQSSRSATVTIVSGSKEQRTVTITQEAAELPIISLLTLIGNSVGRHEATMSFSVSSEFAITACGLCYSETSAMPTVDDNTLLTGSNTSAVVLSGLEAGVTYYVRAFATSDIGTTYSDNVVTVTTLGTEPGSDDNPFPNPR